MIENEDNLSIDEFITSLNKFQKLRPEGILDNLESVFKGDSDNLISVSVKADNKKLTD